VYLKVHTVNTASNPPKQWYHDPLELYHVNCFQNFFKFTQEHHLFLTIRYGPILQQPPDDNARQLRLFLHELCNAVRQLLEVHPHRFGLVQGDQNPPQEDLVLLLQRQRKPTNYAPKNLQQLSDPIVPLSLKHKLKKQVVNGFPYVGPMNHELAINPMHNGLQAVPLPRILRIKQLQQP